MDINERGQVVGEAETRSGEKRAFLWQNGAMTNFVSLGTSSTAASINNNGEVAGDIRGMSTVRGLFCGEKTA